MRSGDSGFRIQESGVANQGLSRAWGIGLFLLLLVALGVVLSYKLDDAHTHFAHLNDSGLEPFVRGQSPEDDDRHTPPPVEKKETPAWTGAAGQDAFRAPQTPFARPEARKQLQTTSDPFAASAPRQSEPPAVNEASVPRNLFAEESASPPTSRPGRSVPALSLTGESAAGHGAPSEAAEQNPFTGSPREAAVPSSTARRLPPPDAPLHREGDNPFRDDQQPSRSGNVTARWEEQRGTSGSDTAIRRVSASDDEPQPTLAAEQQPFDLMPVPIKPAVPSGRSEDGLTKPVPIPVENPLPTLDAEPQPFGAFDTPPPAQREKTPAERPAPSFFEEARSATPARAPSGNPGFEFASPAEQRQMVPPQAAERRSPPTEEISAEQVHEVQPGENYWTISRQHYGAGRYFSALAEYNRHRIPHPERMKPGMIVLIPDARVLYDRYPSLTNGPPEGVSDPDASDRNRFGFFIDENGQPMYRVDQGDTLGEIAQKHLGRSSRWVQIHGMNRDQLPDAGTLKIGMVLRLPRDASQVVLAPDDVTVR